MKYGISTDTLLRYLAFLADQNDAGISLTTIHFAGQTIPFEGTLTVETARGALTLISVATKFSRQIAQFRSPAPPRGDCRGPKGRWQSLRSGSRSDSFWGSGQGATVLKCTIAPGFGRKPRGRAGSFSPLPPALRPLPSPTQPAQPAHPRQQEHKHRDTPGVTSLFSE
jgi:hypothetical protein